MATAKDKFNLNQLASDIMFSGRLNLAAHGVEYRKGKTVEDVKKALAKARNPKNGFGTVEYELSMFEVYLRTEIFKRAAPASAATAQVSVA